MSDHSAGTNDGVATYLQSRQDDRPRANERIVVNMDFSRDDCARADVGAFANYAVMID